VRLTILNQYYTPDISPTAHLAASLAEHRAAAGDEVTVVTSVGGYVAVPKSSGGAAESQNPRVFRAWTPKLGKKTKISRVVDYASFYLGAVWKVSTLPAQDVIVTLTTPPFIAIAAIIHKLLHRRTRVVLWNMDCYPEVIEATGVIKKGGLLSKLMRSVNRWLFARIDHLVSLDTAMQELLLSQYAPKGHALPTSIIPNWEKASFFPPDAIAPSPWKDRWQLQDRFVILYLGNTGYGHNFETMLDAAKLLSDDPVAFVFVGGGSRWNEIREGAEKRGLNNVRMQGYVPKEETPSVMSAADCALITLDDFAIGIMSPSKLHSNLAMSLPVIYIGPKGSNVDDAIANFGCGVSVRLGNPSEIATWVRAVMRDREYHVALRTKARRAFDEAYNDLRTLPLFDRVLDAAPRGQITRSVDCGSS
jgi:colanic acid biosynthesis glycosyl transferase WcaI